MAFFIENNRYFYFTKALSGYVEFAEWQYYKKRARTID